MSVIDEITTERYRQVEEEGFSPEHDDQHAYGELAQAACCYAQLASDRATSLILRRIPAPEDWPLAPEAWKPTDARCDLIKAAALIVAEIERLDRAAEREGRR